MVQAALDTHIGQQKIEREDLEVFKCVQVQCVTQGPQETSDFTTCDICARRFFDRANLRRHMVTGHSQDFQYFQYPSCDKFYTRVDNLQTHVWKAHKDEGHFF